MSWLSANSCCPALPSPGPESSSEQLAALERKLRCVEQEKVELSRKLQGMGEPAGQGRVGLSRGLRLQGHLLTWVPPTAEALQTPSDHRELEQLRKEVQILQDRLSGTTQHPVSSPLTLALGVNCFSSTPESSLGSNPIPALYILCDRREAS